MTSFTQKQIEVRFTLGAGQFSAGGNTKVVNGLATRCKITKPGLPDKNGASVTIFGLLPDDMARLTTLNFRPLQVQKNLIQISAGVVGGSTSIAFAGEITSAFADYNSAPDIAFVVEALAGYYPSVTPAAPMSIRGSVSIEEIVSGIAKDIGYQFENFGVTASLLNPILNGSPIEKARTACRNAGVQLFIDDNRLRIAPPDGFVGSNKPVPMSAETGMIGYPTFGSDGIKLKGYYQPDAELGGLINVQSIVPMASGDWIITKLSHQIEANIPGSDNAWITEMEASHDGKTQKDRKEKA
ncbi:baseplate hub protein [Pseudomonas sp. NPDC098747]|uniref:baseplate hub protein n=1 Tax=Pseudomonas sp. NPDC098747 TaxID=3364487 RepID=UPI00383A8C33